jgi:hypothetical protein
MNDFFKKAKDAIPKILKGEMAEEGDSEKLRNHQKTLTPQELENQIFRHYKARFGEESTFNEETQTGSMVYPVSFCIYLHPADFQKLEQRFRFAVKNTVNAFCAFNRKKTISYPDHIPHSPYWTIQFVPFIANSVVEKAGKNYDIVEEGIPLIISDLFSRKFTKDNIQQGDTVVATKHTRDLFSLQKVNLAINQDAFRNIKNPTDKDTFVLEINSDYSKLTTIPKSEDRTQVSEIDTLAYLLCDKDFIGSTNTGKQYNIVTNYIYISGKNDARTGIEYAKIDYPLPPSIVQIKYDNDNFLLAAFGKVRLNGALVTESKGAPDWVKLSDNSKILINGEVDIKFKRTKK